MASFEWSRALTERRQQFKSILRSSPWLVVLAFFAVSHCLPSASFAQEKSAKPWPKPTALLEQLDQLSQDMPGLATWCKTTSQQAEVISDSTLDRQQRVNTLEQLQKQLQLLANANTNILRSNLKPEKIRFLSSEVVRMHYRISRRIEVWSLALQMPVRESLNDPSNQVLQQAAYQRLNFDGLDPTWVDYLLLNEYRDAFESLKPDVANQRETARRILARVYSPALNPEQANYARNVIAPEVIEFLKSHASETVKSSDLLTRVEYYESDASGRFSKALSDSYQNLLWSDDLQDQQMAATLHAHYRNANFRMTVSEAFMKRLVPKLPAMAQPVSETVKGALVSGNSQIFSEVDVHLVPDPERLNFNLQTQGQVLSDTMARVKSVRIFNQGMAWYNINKPITVDRNGIDASQKAFSSTKVQQVLVDIQSNMDNVPLVGNLVRRITENRVREETPESNQIFRRKVAREAEERVEEILQEQIAKVEASADKSLKQPLFALDLDPEPVQLATTANQIIMRYRLAGRDQMAANTARPQEVEGSLISFQVHQSLMNNVIERLGLNGNTFEQDELEAHFKKVLGDTPGGTSAQLGDADDKRERRYAKFEFAKYDPVRIKFVEDRVNVVLNLKKLYLKKGSNRALKNIRMTASYKLATNGLFVRLIQDDSGTLIQGTRKRLRLGEKATVSTVMKILFQKQYDFNALPEQFRDLEQAQSLAISDLILSDGWLGVSLSDQVKPTPRMIDRLPQRFGNLRKAVTR